MERMKKLVVPMVVFCLMVACIVPFMLYRHSTIDDNSIPLVDGIRVRPTQADGQVIPDKYNTGCNESLLTTKVVEAGEYFGVTISNYGTKGKAIYYKTTTPTSIVFENVDFSSDDFIIAKEGEVTKDSTIVFRNCKFGSFTTAHLGDAKVHHYFENCSFIHFAGSNSTFRNCYFGSGSDGDGINPYRNCFFYDCMIADLVKPSETGESNHVDGFQVFGDSSAYKLDCTNIHLENCRFEVPNIPYSSAAGILNCPITFTMRYSNASHVSFKDCIVNGGTYYSIMLYSDTFTFDDVTMENISVGGSRKSANVIGDEPMEAQLTNVHDTQYLYAASVWRDSNAIHVSVTNDTNQERALKVVTSNDTYYFTIPACPISVNIPTDSMNYEDFPFDMDIQVPLADWVVCYDVTNNESEQIRFVNWLDSDVYVVEESVAPVATEAPAYGEIVTEDFSIGTVVGSNNSFGTETDSSVNVQEAEYGICGDSVEYKLYAGVLTLSGTGSTYSYNSTKTAPWYDSRELIQKIIVEEGVTALGTQLFTGCTNLTSVVLAEGLSTIGGNVFAKDSKLATVTLPESLTSIGKYAFASTALETIYYAGTAEMWENVAIGEKNEPINSSIIVYQVGEAIEETMVVAEGVSGDTVNWVFYSDGLLVLSGEGATPSYNSSKPAPWVDYRGQITKIVVEEGITSVGNQAFAQCTVVEEIVFADSVETIGGNTCIKDKALKTVTFGSGLTSIGRFAFSGSGVETIIYRGTEEMWGAVSIGDRNEVLYNATIEYAE